MLWKGNVSAPASREQWHLGKEHVNSKVQVRKTLRRVVCFGSSSHNSWKMLSSPGLELRPQTKPMCGLLKYEGGTTYLIEVIRLSII